MAVDLMLTYLMLYLLIGAVLALTVELSSARHIILWMIGWPVLLVLAAILNR